MRKTDALHTRTTRLGVTQDTDEGTLEATVRIDSTVHHVSVTATKAGTLYVQDETIARAYEEADDLFAIAIRHAEERKAR